MHACLYVYVLTCQEDQIRKGPYTVICVLNSRVPIVVPECIGYCVRGLAVVNLGLFGLVLGSQCGLSL
jgi:hypothetical protein